MTILKKRPVRKTEDDFINGNPETKVEQILVVEETEPQHTDIETSNLVNIPTIDTKKQDSLFSDKAKERLLNDKEIDEEPLRRVTTYIKDSLNKKIKLLSVLTDKKEYQLWNEALSDLLEKYKEKGL